MFESFRELLNYITQLLRYTFLGCVAYSFLCTTNHYFHLCKIKKNCSALLVNYKYMLINGTVSISALIIKCIIINSSTTYLLHHILVCYKSHYRIYFSCFPNSLLSLSRLFGKINSSLQGNE